MSHQESRRAIALETALRFLSRLEVGETLEISDIEEEKYREARKQLPEREFTARKVDHGNRKSVVLTRTK